jgi:hypothetical protein
VIGKIFGPKNDVREQFKVIHNEKLRDLYRLPSIHRVLIVKFIRLRYARYAATMGKMRNAYRISVGKPLEICRLGIPRSCEGNFKMNLGEG